VQLACSSGFSPAARVARHPLHAYRKNRRAAGGACTELFLAVVQAVQVPCSDFVQVATLMFIRRKVIKGVTYYALVESYRKDGKVRQRILFSLCRQPTFEAAIERQSRRIAYWQAENAKSGGNYAIGTIADIQERIKVLQKWQSVVPEKRPGC
jgi:hypothetical protein